MTIVQINTFSYKATGDIMMGIHKLLIANGYNSYVVWGRGRTAENEHEIYLNDDLGVKLHGAYTRVTDKTGFASKAATWRLLSRLDKIQPDIIHLHNIHGYYINIKLLFDYIRKNNIKVVWTFHDCWAFTGHCAWFDMCGCEKWKTGCNHCEQLNTYPASKGLDNSSWNWEKKKKLFTGLDITIVTPSKWLANLVRQSYLKDYPIKVIYNGIDLEVFRPVPTEKIKEKYGFDNRPIVLGVANEWTPRKGLNDFIKLSKMEKGIQFVVVGLKEMQMKKLPNTIKGIERTNSRLELVGLYSLANVFFNPTYEDNFPSTNLEALACGTPVIAYDTGGCSEAIEVFGYSEMHKFGKIIKKISPTTVNIEEVLNVIKSTIKENLDNESSKKYINVNDIDIDTRLREYLRLYGEI